MQAIFSSEIKEIEKKNVERKNYNVVIDWKNVFDQPVKIDLITYENIRKNATGRGDDYNYFKNYYKMRTIDLSKQQMLDDNPKQKENKIILQEI